MPRNHATFFQAGDRPPSLEPRRHHADRHHSDRSGQKPTTNRRPRAGTVSAYGQRPTPAEDSNGCESQPGDVPTSALLGNLQTAARLRWPKRRIHIPTMLARLVLRPPPLAHWARCPRPLMEANYASGRTRPPLGTPWPAQVRRPTPIAPRAPRPRRVRIDPPLLAGRAAPEIANERAGGASVATVRPDAHQQPAPLA